MAHDIFILLLGVVLLVAGGNYLTDGAVAVAKRFNVSPLMIGLTVVALGSSAPDIAVCVEAAASHHTAIAVGEAVGANIFDLLLVVGVMAIIRPWKVGGMMLRTDLPMLVLSCVSLWIVANTVLFDGTHDNMIDRSSGLMLVLLFVIYMTVNVRSAKGAVVTPETHGVASSSRAVAESKGNIRIQALSWLMIVGGFAAIIIGGNWVVEGASGIALKAGMSQGLVALTVVAIANSLPDLVTSVVATVKDQSGLAFGNIIGSSIMNILCALGISSTIYPLLSDSIGIVDYLTLAGASVMVWLFPYLSRNRNLTRPEGILLVVAYLAYMTYLVLQATGTLHYIK